MDKPVEIVYNYIVNMFKFAIFRLIHSFSEGVTAGVTVVLQHA